MLAAVLYGKEHVQLERVPVPRVGPGDMLVRVRAALTCGTDIKVFLRGYHARMIVPPALFGHELAGDVVAVGERSARVSKSASVWWRRIPRPACNAFTAGADASIFAKICCSITALMRNTSGFRRASSG